MDVFGLEIPNKPLTNYELIYYAEKLKIPNFRGVYMRDTLPKAPKRRECGIVNFSSSKEIGTHWVCYFKNKSIKIYFDSYGQITPQEIQNYLKTKRERGVGVIQRNTDIVQRSNTSICGHLCLFVLKALSGMHWTFQQVLNHLNANVDYGSSQADWLSSKTEKRICFT